MPTAWPPADAEVIDLGGKVLMPGLCDAHVHVTAITPNFAELGRMSPFYVTVHTADVLKGMLERGFTTVRDAGGADWGLAKAVAEGGVARAAAALLRQGALADRRSCRHARARPAGTGRVLLLCGARPGLRRRARDAPGLP